jgi:hypothetical protein
VAVREGGDRFDHVVSVMFENRSFDNLLGHLYEPGEVASFEGVIGKDLSNPIPGYAPGAERGVVSLHVATSMDAPSPDAGEAHPHTNTQLFGRVPAPSGTRSEQTFFLPARLGRTPGHRLRTSSARSLRRETLQRSPTRARLSPFRQTATATRPPPWSVQDDASSPWLSA